VTGLVCAAGLSTKSRLQDAVGECSELIEAGLDGAQRSLVFAFASGEYGESLDTLPGALEELVGGGVLLGCSGEMIAGGDREIESGPALSVLAAGMPDSRIEPFRVSFEPTADGLLTTGCPEHLAEAEDVDTVFLLADPFSSQPQSIFDRIAEQTAGGGDGQANGVGILGGMASGGGGPGENHLFLGGEVYRDGAVGVVVRGPGRVESVVSQGCRPIGPTLVVTASESNVVQALGGREALVVLQEMIEGLEESERQLIGQGLHMGLAMSEYGESFERGDFLVSNVIGVDRESGSVVVGHQVRVGQTIRFHVRDAATADEDLVELLQSHGRAGREPRGALLFSCNGRGTRLFGAADHDASTIRRELGEIPLAGFFAQGEIGPVGGTNFVHGFTASVACLG
jgi:small ligand-binding sensory domain FIST